MTISTQDAISAAVKHGSEADAAPLREYLKDIEEMAEEVRKLSAHYLPT